ncbi:VPS10 domain-containing protein [Stygiobacter electus]|uniref:Glycosyl hydrolase n=1 Tax=Stygiobacter electus TaxID=3032292 RepID=A0AAE3P2I5_9BACT|nr:glycosyl hydrolase [Stygiobacter electus]MDF1612592.1 glycosyl hydrolase [Stygiobacter electus]
MKYIKVIISILLFVSITLPAQKEKSTEKKEKELLTSETVAGLKFRGIGPAFTSGRIADFAVNPNNHSEYYVASASGHLWKTTNSGTTWEAIADTLPYSLGVVEIDPTNPNVVWVGTGENNHQRALGYGTGVYKSLDGGKTWKHMGLKDSRQIGGIVIDPKNSNIVYVAAEGSVWGPGGDRGLYKTTDGGKTWNKVLNISENTGVNNVVMDPRDSNVLYATSEQRRRHIFTKIGGGPESAVYKTTDAGATWEKIMNGLPKVDIGGMGIAISPVNPDVVYLIMEAAENGNGFYRSTNRGASWEKMSDHHESGQYYNEIYCDPKDVNKVYSTETVTQFTEDGGKTWKVFGNDNRHVDDHALWIDPNDTNHLLIGGDGGVYETFDTGKTFLFKCNLPVTQFYRVSVDDAKPFYNVYGGTQDNNSFYGPSRTLSSDGIVNSDWIVTVGGDGFFQATEPGNPNIVYSAWQYGNIVRYDKLSGETVDIRPEPAKGEKTFKWYWDTPFIISPHSPTRLYIAAEKVFKSDDRGNSWQEISDDLSTKTDRNSFPVMGKYWSYDAVAKDVSTSLFGLVVSLAESPKKENLLYAGTDDGLIQVTEDLKTWRKIEDFPGVPKFTLVSDILPSRFDENVVYASFNNHKRDDFKPYLLKSTDKGKTWKSIASNLPQDGAVNTIVEDPTNPKLLFVGTEWGVFFSIDGGEKWIQLKNGLPKIKVTDLTIHEGEKDLVVATFGRGFFILDDYSPLRYLTKELFEKESHIFPIKNALMYVQKGGRYGQGSTYFKAPNPEFGATITYYIKDVPKTLKAQRQAKEKELFKDGKPIPQPTFEELRAETDEKAPYLIFTFTDENNNVIRKLTKQASSGINRVVWDLRMESLAPITTDKFEPVASGGSRGRFSSSGYFVKPGKYFVSMSIVVRGEEKKLAGPESFNVELLKNTSLPADDFAKVVEFQQKAAELSRTAQGALRLAEELQKKYEAIKQAINNSSKANYDLFKRAEATSKEIADILYKFNGPTPKASREEIPPVPVPLNSRINDMISITARSTSNITKNQYVAYETLYEEIQPIISQLKKINDVELKSIEAELEKINAPWTPGRIPELK